MSIVEEKTDTMFEIINNVVKEIVSVKNMLFQSQHLPVNTSYLNPNIKTVPMMNETIRFDGNNNIIDSSENYEDDNDVGDDEEEDEEEEEEEEEDEEDEEEDEEDEEEDEEDEEEDEEDEDEDEEEEEEEQKSLVNTSEETEIEEVKVISITLSEQLTVEALPDNTDEVRIEKVELSEPVEEQVKINKEDTMDMYRKMPLPALKTLLITKGLASDPSKMKKYDILKLLENNLNDD
jgi:hypothetical protein